MVNSSRKGKNGERSLCKMLNKRFASILAQNPEWGEFHRSVGSGNRWSQANIAESDNSLYSGDVICKNFSFVIESKIGYDIDLLSLFNGCKAVDEFISQVEQDSIRCGKKPLLIWKKNRKPEIAFLRDLQDQESFSCVIRYKDWLVVSLQELLKLPDGFFFDGSV